MNRSLRFTDCLLNNDTLLHVIESNKDVLNLQFVLDSECIEAITPSIWRYERNSGELVAATFRVEIAF